MYQRLGRAFFFGRSLFFSDDLNSLPYYNRGHYYYQNSSTARKTMDYIHCKKNLSDHLLIRNLHTGNVQSLDEK